MLCKANVDASYACGLYPQTGSMKHQMHDYVSAHGSNDTAYTGEIAPSLRQAPFQCIAAQNQFLQLHQECGFFIPETVVLNILSTYSQIIMSYLR